MSQPTPALNYATPGASTGSPTAAGVWIMLGGLALILFGGCFCIGILLATTPAVLGAPVPMTGPLTSAQLTFVSTMYLFAVACFVPGAYVLFLGLRKLLSVGR